MENGIVSMVVAFILVAIVLSIGVTILGSTSSGFDCKLLAGYDSSGSNDAAKFPAGTWAGSCHQVQSQAQSSFLLLVVILVVVAASAIIMVVRMF